jgi:hypothetical protein
MSVHQAAHKPLRIGNLFAAKGRLREEGMLHG